MDPRPDRLRDEIRIAGANVTGLLPLPYGLFENGECSTSSFRSRSARFQRRREHHFKMGAAPVGETDIGFAHCGQTSGEVRRCSALGPLLGLGEFDESGFSDGFEQSGFVGEVAVGGRSGDAEARADFA